MINNVVLIGRLTKDCELNYTANGAAVGSFTLAVNRNYSNHNGEREADFIRCVIWRKPAETFANYTRKGSLVGITGKIQTRNYENQQGQRVYLTEIVVDEFQLLESKEKSETRYSQNSQNFTGNRSSNSNEHNYTQKQENVPSTAKKGIADDLGFNSAAYDDDLPF